MAKTNQDKVRSVFLFLVGKAVRGEATTYKEVALHCGLPSAGNALGGVLGPILGEIYAYCESHELPYLTVLVVRASGKDRGLPGAGFWVLYNQPGGISKHEITHIRQQEVFNFFDLTKTEVE